MSSESAILDFPARMLVLGGILILVLSPILSAQPRPGRGPGTRPPRGDNFSEAIREAQRIEGTNQELLGFLLRHESIQQEIGIGEEHIKELRDLISDAIRAAWELRRESRDEEWSKEQLVEIMLERQRTFDRKVTELLEEHADYERLLGIFVQTRSYRAATHASIAERIGLEGEQLLEYREARSKLWHALMKANRWRIEDYIRERKNDEIERLMKYAENRLDELLAARLSEDQRARLESLEGEEFDLPEEVFSMRRPPGGDKSPRRDGGHHDDKSKREDDQGSREPSQRGGGDERHQGPDKSRDATCCNTRHRKDRDDLPEAVDWWDYLETPRSPFRGGIPGV